MRIFAINPGSTSTKIALFEDGNVVFSQNVSHDAHDLAQFEGISAQLSYRMETIIKIMTDAGVSMRAMDAFVGRGGGLLPLEGGTYEVDDLLLSHAVIGANGISHPAQLGSQLAKVFQTQYGGRAFVVNPPDVDELQDLARMTGIAGIYRMVHLHALNLKETAIRHAQSIGRQYEDCQFVVCHIGGGISVSAHRKGKMIDGNDIVGGDGPMAPTRCGAVSVAGILSFIEGHSVKELKSLCTASGGLVSHLGTSDALEVYNRGLEGDKKATLIWDTMVYQIIKYIGAMAAALHGNIEGILLSGGLVKNEDLVNKIRKACSWIAPVTAYPGEFEMEAMASGAERVLTGMEKVKHYSGESVWKGFDF